jgi:SAM-dependent methyltransferase
MLMSLDRTQAFFRQYANDFDAIYGNQNGLINSVINRLFRKSMRLRFEKSIEGCNPIEGKSVLDIGCGPGHYSITLDQRGAVRVVGIDFAEGMLQLATEHAAKVGIGEICKFVVADFYTYPPQELFDYVIVMGFMDYMPDPEKVVAKVLSLTRDKAFFSFPVAGGILGWQRAIPVAGQQCFLRMCFERSACLRTLSSSPFRTSSYQGGVPAHAVLDHHSRRRTHHDGATLPFRSVVLLLPSGRSSSRDSSVAAH